MLVDPPSPPSPLPSAFPFFPNSHPSSPLFPCFFFFFPHRVNTIRLLLASSNARFSPIASTAGTTTHHSPTATAQRLQDSVTYHRDSKAALPWRGGKSCCLSLLLLLAFVCAAIPLAFSRCFSLTHSFFFTLPWNLEHSLSLILCCCFVLCALSQACPVALLAFALFCPIPDSTSTPTVSSTTRLDPTRYKPAQPHTAQTVSAIPSVSWFQNISRLQYLLLIPSSSIRSCREPLALSTRSTRSFVDPRPGASCFYFDPILRRDFTKLPSATNTTPNTPPPPNLTKRNADDKVAQPLRHIHPAWRRD